MMSTSVMMIALCALTAAVSGSNPVMKRLLAETKRMDEEYHAHRRRLGLFSRISPGFKKLKQRLKDAMGRNFSTFRSGTSTPGGEFEKGAMVRFKDSSNSYCKGLNPRDKAKGLKILELRGKYFILEGYPGRLFPKKQLQVILRASDPGVKSGSVTAQISSTSIPGGASGDEENECCICFEPLKPSEAVGAWKCKTIKHKIHRNYWAIYERVQEIGNM